MCALNVESGKEDSRRSLFVPASPQSAKTRSTSTCRARPLSLELDSDCTAINKDLSEHQQTFQQLGPYDGPATLNLMEFDHWRDRLLEVYDVVFQSPPVSWAQLWRDRRNPQQFWTFWIALIILALTLISTVTSVVQIWVSVRAIHG